MGEHNKKSLARVGEQGIFCVGGGLPQVLKTASLLRHSTRF